MTGTGDATLRQSNEGRLADKIEPDFMKSDTQKARETGTHLLDTAASYLPGQTKARDAANTDAANPVDHGTHDTGRAGLGSTGDAFKPSSEQSVGEWTKVKADQAAAYITPNSQKSTTQATKDTLTPGNDSTLTPHGAHEGQGVLGSIGQAVGDAKDAVLGVLDDRGGENKTHTHQHDGVGETEL